MPLSKGNKTSKETPRLSKVGIAQRSPRAKKKGMGERKNRIPK